jgi:general secretion pathway protein H
LRRASERFSISRIPNAESRLAGGFSLIEILVVMVIVAVLAATVTIAIAGAAGPRQLARDGERLRALIGYACEQAELDGRQIGISLSTAGYAFSRSDHADWLPERDGELRPRKWSVAPVARLSRDGHAVAVAADFPDKPQLVCFSSGELTAFRLDLRLADAPQVQRIDGDADGELRLSQADAPAR